MTRRFCGGSFFVFVQPLRASSPVLNFLFCALLCISVPPQFHHLKRMKQIPRHKNFLRFLHNQCNTFFQHKNSPPWHHNTSEMSSFLLKIGNSILLPQPPQTVHSRTLSLILFPSFLNFHADFYYFRISSRCLSRISAAQAASSAHGRFL